MSEVRADKTNTKFEKQASFKPVFAFLILSAMVLGIFIGLLSKSVFGFFDRALLGDDETTQDIETVDVNSISTSDLYDEDYVNQILDVFNTKYIKDLEDYDGGDLTYGAIKGIITSLDDPYTSFLTPTEAEEYLSQRSGDFEGIGVTLGYKDGYSYVESVLKSHPAESVGILPQDFIVQVDGEDMAGKYPSEVANKIRGDKGTDVKLKIFRQKETSETLDFTVTRDEIKIDNVMWENLGDGIVKITIVQFNDESINAFNQSWDRVVDEIDAEMGEIKGIVVDLRNNPGGYVNSVQHVLEEFLDDGQILMKEKAKNTKEVVYEDNRPGKFQEIPLVVLVNEGSASASEIFAAGIRENDRGVVVGKPTVGKGVEQELMQLSDGSILLIVFQQWLTPDGNEISKDKPIQPDEVVDFSVENFEKGEDPQLDKAIEILK